MNDCFCGEAQRRAEINQYERCGDLVRIDMNDDW